MTSMPSSSDAKAAFSEYWGDASSDGSELRTNKSLAAFTRRGGRFDSPPTQLLRDSPINFDPLEVPQTPAQPCGTRPPRTSWTSPGTLLDGVDPFADLAEVFERNDRE